MELTNKTYKDIEEYIFHFDHVQGLWLLCSSNTLLSHGLLLSDFMILRHISIPPDCSYCFYRTDCADIKFRVSGSYIHIFITNKNGQDSQIRD